MLPNIIPNLSDTFAQGDLAAKSQRFDAGKIHAIVAAIAVGRFRYFKLRIMWGDKTADVSDVQFMWLEPTLNTWPLTASVGASSRWMKARATSVVWMKGLQR